MKLHKNEIKTDAIQKLKKLKRNDEAERERAEQHHADATEVILNLLTKLGYKDVVDEWKDVVCGWEAGGWGPEDL